MQKYILRQAVKDVIPEKIFNRKDKIGFLSPQDKWLKNELKDVYGEKMEENQKSETKEKSEDAAELSKQLSGLDLENK